MKVQASANHLPRASARRIPRRRFKPLLDELQPIRELAERFSQAGCTHLPLALSDGLKARPGSDDRAGVVRVDVAAAELGAEGAADRLVEQLMSAAPAQTGQQRLAVRFEGGQLAGLECLVWVHRGRVRCRMRAEGAELRRQLGRLRSRLSGRLEAGGMRLVVFEVKR
ncbi:MAG: hypothetical protein JXR96_01235 [Deltaproteobacteria bacterium]|nr:hypothetical protein [Deltaproteobacteria bacterium]